MRRHFPFVLLLILILLFLIKAIPLDRVLVPWDITANWSPWRTTPEVSPVHNTILNDVVTYIYPYRQWMREQLLNGEWPLWNPSLLLGLPFTYNTQAGLYYPLTLLYYLLPLHIAFDLVIFVQMLLGGWFFYGYMRLWFRPIPALTSAIIFLFNGMMVVWLEWQVIHAAVIWLPLTLYATEKLRLAPTPARQRQWSAVWAVGFALAWLNGHWNWTIYVSMIAGSYLLWRLYRQTPWHRPILPLLWGLSLPAVQILPALTYLSQTQRGPLTWDKAATLGTRWQLIFAPYWFGSHRAGTWQLGWETNFNELTLYCSVTALILLLLSLLFSPKKSRQTPFPSRFWLLWLTLGTLWMLATPAYRLLHALPVFSGLWPSRASVLFVVAVAALAGAGSASLERLPRSQWIALLAMLLIIGELFWFGWGFNTVNHLAQAPSASSSAEFLHRQTPYFRQMTVGQGSSFPPNSFLPSQLHTLNGYEPGILRRLINYVQLAEGGENPIRFDRHLLPLAAANSPLLDALNVRYLLTTQTWFTPSAEPNDAPLVPPQRWQPLPLRHPLTVRAGGLQRLELWLRGTGPVTATLFSADLSYQFAHATLTLDGRDTPYPFPFTPFADEWGRDFVVQITGEGAEMGFSADGQPLIAPYLLAQLPLLHQENGSNLYLRPHALPRAYVVHRLIPAHDEPSALAQLAEHQNDLAHLAIVEGVSAEQLATVALTDRAEQVAITQYRNNRVSLRANLASDGFVILADTFYEGWRARLDGEPVPIYRTNSVVRGLFVPAGEHEIEYLFRPNDWLLGLSLSLVALLTMIAASLLRVKQTPSS